MRKLTAALAFVALATLAACEQTGEGEYEVPNPDVDVGTNPDTIQTPDVDVGTDTVTAETPDVDVGTDTVTAEVPDVDVNEPE